MANASRNFLAGPKNFNFFSGTATSAMDRASVKYLKLLAAAVVYYFNLKYKTGKQHVNVWLAD